MRKKKKGGKGDEDKKINVFDKLFYIQKPEKKVYIERIYIRKTVGGVPSNLFGVVQLSILYG